MNQQMLNLNEKALNETELDSAKSKYALRPPSSSFGLTPMMVQYIQIKEKHESNILFYRMGDFYEMFFEDAIESSSLLEITLTNFEMPSGPNLSIIPTSPFFQKNEPIFLAGLTKTNS